MVIVAVAGVSLVLRGLGHLIAKKWAAQNSRCVAMAALPLTCSKMTEEQLRSHFSFRDVKVRDSRRRGIIHSEIQARLLGGILISGRYDLEPSEYKRVQK